MADDPHIEAFGLICHSCSSVLTCGEGSFYVVKIEAFADPSPPNLDSNKPSKHLSTEINELIEQMSDLSEQELMDQVYRRLILLMCRPCYELWIEDPTGTSAS
ncbi:MAG: hypothetical protein IH984_06615 [Planctomycetes bacterium]|nr:hypothetical protein [Planctomycetota bacterium]